LIIVRAQEIGGTEMSTSKGKKKSVKKKVRPSSAMRIKASIPITVSPEVREHLKELKAKEDLSKITVESSKITEKQKVKPDKFGLDLEKRGEEIGLAFHVPSAPVSLVAPNQKMQGEIRYHDRMHRLAIKIRKRKKVRRKR